MTYEEIKQQFREEYVLDMRKAYVQGQKDAMNALMKTMCVCMDEITEQGEELINEIKNKDF